MQRGDWAIVEHTLREMDKFRPADIAEVRVSLSCVVYCLRIDGDVVSRTLLDTVNRR